MNTIYVALIGEDYYKDKYKAAEAIRKYTQSSRCLSKSRWYTRETFAVVDDGWRTMSTISEKRFLELLKESWHNTVVVSKNNEFIGFLQ